MWKKIVLGIVVLFVGIQFFGKSPGNPEYDKSNDMIEQLQPNQEVQSILTNACYDCHSNETKYPFYSKIVPVSLWMKGHIEDGRKHLNFSDWGNYELERQQHKLEECVEMMESGEMPLLSYTLGHPEAKLSTEQRELLMEYFNGLK